MHLALSRLSSLVYVLLALALALPVLAVLGSWLQWSGQSADILLEMARTVLPDYVVTTLGLCLMVAVGVTVLGLACAALVTLFDFPGRGVLEWLLLLPLAMPAYVVSAAGVCARNTRCARPLVARCAQRLGGGAGVHPFAVPVCVLAGPHRFGRTRFGLDGSGQAFGCAFVSPHP
jgi:ABC-type sugar transport system permease subunit